jgi:hypothetical protein
MWRKIAAGLLLFAEIVYVFENIEVYNRHALRVSKRSNVQITAINTAGRYADEEASLFAFIQKHLMGRNGEILTNIKGSENSPETLSESVGLLMNYCVMRELKELFDREYAFLKNSLLAEGKYVKWKTSSEDIHCNSAIDDMRIIRALLDAYEKWGVKEYYDTAGFIQDALYEKQTVDGFLMEFYDWKLDAARMSIPLCYIDLNTMYRLGTFNKNWKQSAEKGLRIIKNGRIDEEENPFFHKYYDFNARAYRLDEEAAQNKGICLTYTLYTAIHLAEYNENTEAFTAWLKKEAKNGRLYGWYNPYTLKPASDLESTAVYALAAIYSGKVGEEELEKRLINRMLDFMITDKKSPYYGGFGNTQTMDFYSFDNLTALWALAEVGQ